MKGQQKFYTSPNPILLTARGDREFCKYSTFAVQIQNRSAWQNSLLTPSKGNWSIQKDDALFVLHVSDHHLPITNYAFEAIKYFDKLQFAKYQWSVNCFTISWTFPSYHQIHFPKTWHQGLTLSYVSCQLFKFHLVYLGWTSPYFGCHYENNYTSHLLFIFINMLQGHYFQIMFLGNL